MSNSRVAHVPVASVLVTCEAGKSDGDPGLLLVDVAVRREYYRPFDIRGLPNRIVGECASRQLLADPCSERRSLRQWSP